VIGPAEPLTEPVAEPVGEAVPPLEPPPPVQAARTLTPSTATALLASACLQNQE